MRALSERCLVRHIPIANFYCAIFHQLSESRLEHDSLRVQVGSWRKSVPIGGNIAHRGQLRECALMPSSIIDI